jgi:hypothetical protein
MRKLIALAAATCVGGSLIGLAGCQWLGLSCTQVGCFDGARLTVYDADGNALDYFHGVIRFEDDRELAFVCARDEEGGGVPGDSLADVYCYGNEVEISGSIAPVEVTIESDVADERGAVDLLLSLEENAPNGEACGPVCLYATVDVRLERPE